MLSFVISGRKQKRRLPSCAALAHHRPYPPWGSPHLYGTAPNVESIYDPFTIRGGGSAAIGSIKRRLFSSPDNLVAKINQKQDKVNQYSLFFLLE